MYCYDDIIDRISADLDDYIFMGPEHFEIGSKQYILVDSKTVESFSVMNVDWQWNRLKTIGKLLGLCGDNSQTQSEMLKSVNVSSIVEASASHSSPAYYNHKDDVWRNNPYEENIYLSEVVIKHFRGGYEYSKLPWDNGLLNIRRDANSTLLYSNDPSVFSKGVPLGYIYRTMEPFY